jgi:heat-inducible transcriptional repressor
VEQRLVDLPAPIDTELVNDARQLLNDTLVGLYFVDTTRPILDMCEHARPELRGPLSALSSVLLETLTERPDERVALAGTANLTRNGPMDFAGTLSGILEALEEQVVLLKLFGQVERAGQNNDADLTRVCIGDENEFEGLRATSVVTTGYGPGNTVVGGLGVLGPTRMDYPATIAAVRTVARYVGDVLAQ